MKDHDDQREPKPRASRPTRVRLDADSLISLIYSILVAAARPMYATELLQEIESLDRTYLFRTTRWLDSVRNQLDRLRDLRYADYVNGRYVRKVMNVHDLDVIVDEAVKRNAITLHFFEQEDDEVRVCTRQPPSDNLEPLAVLDAQDGQTLLSELRSRVVEEEPDRPIGWFQGHIRVRGANVAVSASRDVRGIQHIAMHLGQPSIDAVDIHIMDRARLVHDLFDRLPDDVEDNSIRSELIRAANATTNLSKFDLDEFAAARGVPLKPRPRFDFKSDREVMLETFKRLKEQGKNMLSGDEDRIRLDVMIEFASRALDAEADSARAEELSRVVAAYEEERRLDQEFLAKRARIDAGIDQEPIDEDELADQLRALGKACLNHSLGPDVEAAVRSIVDMMPMGDPFEDVWREIVADNDRFVNVQSVVGKLVDAAHHGQSRSIDTRSERAARICLAMMYAAYDEAKAWGVLLFEPRNEASG